MVRLAFLWIRGVAGVVALARNCRATGNRLQESYGQWLIAHDQVSVPLDLNSGRALLNLDPE
jgi:hypothetical protein